jgi:hypothetical protein
MLYFKTKKNTVFANSAVTKTRTKHRPFTPMSLRNTWHTKHTHTHIWTNEFTSNTYHTALNCTNIHDEQWKETMRESENIHQVNKKHHSYNESTETSMNDCWFHKFGQLCVRKNISQSNTTVFLLKL